MCRKADDEEKIRGGAKKLITLTADLARKTQETVLAVAKDGKK
jgi:hypothetical protein